MPYASHDHEGYTARMQQFLGSREVELVGLHTFQDTAGALSDFDSIYVGGGNSFLLVKELHERGLVVPIRDMVLRGASYLGVSAGANVASPTMMTTNDMPIVLPPSFESMGVVPFQINPHYHPGKILFMDGEDMMQHFGESRAQRIAEFHRQSEAPVLGMWEGVVRPLGRLRRHPYRQSDGIQGWFGTHRPRRRIALRQASGQVGIGLLAGSGLLHAQLEGAWQACPPHRTASRSNIGSPKTPTQASWVFSKHLCRFS